ncbi:MAG TPA: TIGR00730 family Rossman fold protein [Balneolaceae bacterium]|nr:TIGR00730 family Rossman fold protein [Balneolaceae bacterium]
MSDCKVCVFCGSRTGNNPAHTAFAKNLGHTLAEHDFGLVFGAGSIGLMNEIANAVIENGGDTHGVIPQHLDKRERTHKRIGKLKITKNMHERKATMAKLSDAFIALPGGFGTFEELLEIITWAQLGLHKKPIIVANVDGYYDSLLTFFDEATATGFITPENRTLFYTATTVEQCIEYLISKTASITKKSVAD